MAWTKTYAGDEPMRINKWLALEGVCSRREADALIANGQITLDGEPMLEAGRKIEAGETLSLTERAARGLNNQLSLIFNKPVGIVSGTPEEGEVPAVRLITAETLSGRAHAIPGRYNKLAPLGRLDKDSRGLLILSEDGVLAKALIGPESKLEKEYHVRVGGTVTEEKLNLLRHGLELDGRKLRPAIVEQVGEGDLRIILREGRNRQIRRMCSLVRLTVLDLYRDRIGPISIAGMPEGRWRPISKQERDELLRWETQAFSARPNAPDISDRPKSTRPTRTPKPGDKAFKKAAKTADKPDKKGPSALKGEKFKRTKLASRTRTPIK